MKIQRRYLARFLAGIPFVLLAGCEYWAFWTLRPGSESTPTQDTMAWLIVVPTTLILLAAAIICAVVAVQAAEEWFSNNWDDDRPL